MIRVAPEGKPFIAGAWFIAALLAALAPWWLILLWLPIAVWVIAFFRDPARTGPRGDNVLIAPADGVVVGVINVDEPDYMKERSQRISIFVNLPLDSLNKLSLQEHLDEIGKTGTIASKERA